MTRARGSCWRVTRVERFAPPRVAPPTPCQWSILCLYVADSNVCPERSRNRVWYGRQHCIVPEVCHGWGRFSDTRPLWRQSIVTFLDSLSRFVRCGDNPCGETTADRQPAAAVRRRKTSQRSRARGSWPAALRSSNRTARWRPTWNARIFAAESAATAIGALGSQANDVCRP
jgi:hypothetical protein